MQLHAVVTHREHLRRVAEGIRLPDNRPVTANELAWLEMLRAISGDADPPPSLAAVQALRQVLTRACPAV